MTDATATPPPTHGPEGTFTRTIETAELDAEAARLRSMRLSYAQIGRQMSCDKTTARRRVQRALAAVPVEAVNELRAVESEALDTSMRALLVIAQDATASQSERVAAYRELRLHMESKRRLFGIDMPAQVKVTVSDTLTSEIEQLVSMLGIEDGAMELPSGEVVSHDSSV